MHTDWHKYDVIILRWRLWRHLTQRSDVIWRLHTQHLSVRNSASSSWSIVHSYLLEKELRIIAARTFQASAHLRVLYVATQQASSAHICFIAEQTSVSVMSSWPVRLDWREPERSTNGRRGERDWQRKEMLRRRRGTCESHLQWLRRLNFIVNRPWIAAVEVDSKPN